MKRFILTFLFLLSASDAYSSDRHCVMVHDAQDIRNICFDTIIVSFCSPTYSAYSCANGRGGTIIIAPQSSQRTGLPKDEIVMVETVRRVKD